MTGGRTLQVILFALVGTTVLGAADFSKTRGFQFGASLTTVPKQAGVAPSEAKLVYRRPAIIQELEWRAGSDYGETAPVIARREAADKLQALEKARALNIPNVRPYDVAL